MNINIRSIEAFKNISESAIQRIKNEAEYKKFEIGQTIAKGDTISNKVNIIINGEARFVHIDGSRPTSIFKLEAGTFIGLSSILNVNSCEIVAASSELFCLELTDTLILYLYKEEQEFQNWCNETVLIADAYQIALKIHNDQAKNRIGIKKLCLN